MITNRIKNCIKYFLKFQNRTTFTNLWDWDQKLDCLATAKPWYMWNARFIVFSGYCSLFFLIYYTTVHAQHVFTSPGALLAFQTTAWMEISLNIMILLFYHRLHRKCPETVFAFNQLLQYTDVFDKLITRRKHALKRREQIAYQNFKRITKYNEILCIIITAAAVIGAAGFPLIITNKDEPIRHVIVWLTEIPVSFDLQSIPIFVGLSMVIHVADTCVYMCVIMGLCYIIMAGSSIHLMTPVKIQHGTSTVINTKLLGKLEEQVIVEMFRKHQVLNKLMNDDVYASLFISFHHLVMMLVFVVPFYLLIGNSKVVFTESPVIVPLMLIFAICMSLLAEFVESIKVADVVDSSREFVRETKRLSKRKSSLYKFAVSCPNYLGFGIAYPFYTITRETFPEFCCEGVDFVITLLNI